MATRKGQSLFDISNNNKVLDAILKFGPVGYAVILKLEEYIQNSESGTIRDVPMTYNKISVELNTSRNSVFEVIDFLKDNKYILIEDEEATIPRAKEEVLRDNELREKRGNTGGGRKPNPPPKYSEEFNEKYTKFIEYLNKEFKREFKGDKKSKRQFHARLKDQYTTEHFVCAIQNLKKDDWHSSKKFRYATPDFFTREDKLIQWSMKDAVIKESVKLGSRLGDD